MTHLDTLNLMLSHARASLAVAKTSQERAIGEVLADQIKREVDGEKAFLGIQKNQPIDDDALLLELGL